MKHLWRNAEECKLVDGWLSIGLGENTIRQYLVMLRYAQEWCAARGLSLRLLPAHLVVDLANTLPKTWSSRQRLRSTLRAYWDVTHRRNAPLGAVRVPHKPQMHSRALDESAAARLERVAQNRRDRKGLAVLLALYLGLRRAEIAALRWVDLEADLRWIRVTGKGDVVVELPVHPRLATAVRQLPERGPSPWVFPGRFGGHVVPATIWDWMGQVAEQAQLHPFGGPHVLRHTCLTTANDATRDLRAVQMFARHTRPETTAGYTRVGTKRLISVMLALDYKQVPEEAS